MMKQTNKKLNQKIKIFKQIKKLKYLNQYKLIIFRLISLNKQMKYHCLQLINKNMMNFWNSKNLNKHNIKSFFKEKKINKIEI